MVWVKFTKFFMSFLKTRISFSSTFASLLIVMTQNSSIDFSSNYLYEWTKSSNQDSNFQTVNCSHEKLTKFLLLFFKPQVSFLLNFASPFSVMTYNSSEMFLLKHYSMCFGQMSPSMHNFSDF